MSIKLETRVHYTGYPRQTGTVKSARNAVKTARGVGRSFQRTVKIVQYYVEWDNRYYPSGWFWKSELVQLDLIKRGN